MSLITSTPTDRSAALTDEQLVHYFRRSIHDAAIISPSFLALWKDIYSLVQAGGKRLRPQMVYLGYRAFGGQHLQRIAPVAAATELLHLSMLIHDDIIDRDLVRYGVDNITARYMARYSSAIPDDEERRHYAESAAILAGDLLLSGAHQLIASSHLDHSTKTKVQTIFSRSIFEVAAGELIDTESSFVDPKLTDPLAVARYKTAGYSFISPLLIGATLAGANSAQREAVRQFAEQLGIAFQLQDDILGVFGNSSVTGKSTLGDLREGKRTFLIESFYKLADPEQITDFDRHFADPTLNETEAETIRELLVTSGARSQVELEITRLQGQAIAALAAMQLSSEHHSEFVSLINKALKRTF